LKGIKFTIPYDQKYSQRPERESQELIVSVIKGTKKVPEDVELDMLLIVVKSLEKPILKHVLSHVLTGTSYRSVVNPQGIFADWNKSGENVIVIHAQQNFFV